VIKSGIGRGGKMRAVEPPELKTTNAGTSHSLVKLHSKRVGGVGVGGGISETEKDAGPSKNWAVG